MRGFAVFVLVLVLLIISLTSKWSKREKEREDEAVRRRNERWSTMASLGSAIFNELVGRFKQINGQPTYKHVSGGMWGMEQINVYGEPLFKPNGLGSACRFLGKAASFSALTMHAFTISSSATRDSKHSTLENIVCSGSKAVGGYYGAAYGATAGVAIVSSLTPIFGPLLGGVLGGSAGVYFGSAAAGYAAATIGASPVC